MLGAGKRVVETPELARKQKALNKMWKVLQHYLIPRGNYGKRNCSKCSGTNHKSHLTRIEKRNDKIATKILDAFEGLL